MMGLYAVYYRILRFRLKYRFFAFMPEIRLILPPGLPQVPTGPAQLS